MGWRTLAATALMLPLLTAHAADSHRRDAEVAIIIDDIGDAPDLGRQAVELPGPVACAFLPHTPYARNLAREAWRRDKEVLLHLPLESLDKRPLGPGGVTLGMDRQQVISTLRSDLASIPHVMGVNNHMGSMLTQHPGLMAWIMDEMHANEPDLFFVDSYTTPRSVALQVADEAGVPAVRRKVFLDDDLDPAAIRSEFARLIEVARRDGAALAIGHPHPQTLAVLREELPRLSDESIRLVRVSDLIQRRERRQTTWQASSSPWHPASRR